jgi:CheY-like chemotaxis protein
VLVILDFQMPYMNGFELAERMRRNPRTRDTKAIMLTSSGQRGDAVRCKELSIDGYLMKPVRRSDLFRAVQSALGTDDPKPKAAHLVTRHSLRETSLHILLAEDSVVNQRVAFGLLERLGHTIVVATNGREAVEAFEREPFDLILMDVQMPEMDGFEATVLIREREKKETNTYESLH